MPSSRLKSCHRISRFLLPTSMGHFRTARKPGGAVSSVVLGVGVDAVKSGRDPISASLQSESGYEAGLFDRTVDLEEGNQTVVVEFNARNFDRLDDGTRLFLRDLVITEENETVDEIAEAWSSGEMNLGG